MCAAAQVFLIAYGFAMATRRCVVEVSSEPSGWRQPTTMPSAPACLSAAMSSSMVCKGLNSFRPSSQLQRLQPARPFFAAYPYLGSAVAKVTPTRPHYAVHWDADCLLHRLDQSCPSIIAFADKSLIGDSVLFVRDKPYRSRASARLPPGQSKAPVDLLLQPKSQGVTQGTYVCLARHAQEQHRRLTSILGGCG